MKKLLFELRPRNLWGDYGDVLVSGYYEKEGPSSPLLLHRTGPFLPPISFPFCSPDHAVVVTTAIKESLQAHAFPAIYFREAVLARIIPSDWHEWDLSAQNPRRRPHGGEPENYIWKKKDSRATAAKMGQAWEMICPVIPCVYSSWLREDCADTERLDPSLILANGDYEGVFCPAPGHLPVVDETARKWFSANVPEWVELVPLNVEHDPDVLDTLEAIRKRNQEIAPHLTSAEYRRLLCEFCEQHGYAIPAAINQENSHVSRYCIILLNSAQPKVSALTYSDHVSIAAYIEHRRRVAQVTDDPLSLLLVYDLETRQRGHYQENGRFVFEECMEPNHSFRATSEPAPGAGSSTREG